jgi:hypothetical protein
VPEFASLKILVAFPKRERRLMLDIHAELIVLQRECVDGLL